MFQLESSGFVVCELFVTNGRLQTRLRLYCSKRKRKRPFAKQQILANANANANDRRFPQTTAKRLYHGTDRPCTMIHILYQYMIIIVCKRFGFLANDGVCVCVWESDVEILANANANDRLRLRLRYVCKRVCKRVRKRQTLLILRL